MKIITAQQTRKICLTGATVAYAPSPAETASYVRMIAALAGALGGKAVAQAEAESYALLVGATEKTNALLAGKQNAFAICAEADGVTLCGTDALSTLMAVQYFKENLVGEEIPLTIVAEDIATLIYISPPKPLASRRSGALTEFI